MREPTTILINYVEPPDIPEGMTIVEWRRQRHARRDPQPPWRPVRWIRTKARR